MDSFRQLIPSDPVRIDYSEKMYSGEEITLLFNSSQFLEGSNGPWKENGKASSRYWIPFLCLFHGMRAGEASQLYVSNIREEDGVTFMEVTDYGDMEEGVATRTKRVKTKASIRKVPLHPEMVRLGFMDFIQMRRKIAGNDKNVPLFKEMIIDANSDLPASNAISKWFSRLRKEVFGKPKFRGDKSLHAFRHGFRAACDRRVGNKLKEIVSRDLVDAICGWTGRGNTKGTIQGICMVQVKPAILCKLYTKQSVK